MRIRKGKDITTTVQTHKRGEGEWRVLGVRECRESAGVEVKCEVGEGRRGGGER